MNPNQDKKWIYLLLLLIVGILVVLFIAKTVHRKKSPQPRPGRSPQASPAIPQTSHPLMIEAMRAREYPGSEITIEQELEAAPAYNRFIVSYRSDGFKIYALLTIPKGENPPTGGWPAIVANHGYADPDKYRTPTKPQPRLDGFSKNGYVVLYPDYRGHGHSEGEPSSGYGSPDYTVDSLNAYASLKKRRDVNPKKIGMWGHSMGGHITLRSMVVNPDIKVGVTWAGQVAPLEELVEKGENSKTKPGQKVKDEVIYLQTELLEKHGYPDENPDFWYAITPNNYLEDISGPLELHHGTNDTIVAYTQSKNLYNDLKDMGKEAEYFEYPGDDHDLSKNLDVASKRSVAFFDRYLK